ncbi:MAG: hypothetical protein M0C28_24765 [Candidatus Moduliflexus flocculans]|nr:hypothetical protein [Candidatus Moduliflexus flocculans]
MARTRRDPPRGQTSLKAGRRLSPAPTLETFVHLGDQISHYEAVDARYAGQEMPRKHQGARPAD